jgi:transposase InsO family protein
MTHPGDFWRFDASGTLNGGDTALWEAVAIDFAVVPTVTFELLFVFVVLGLERRKILHCNVTEHPTAQWTGQQLVEALPWETTARYVIRDRDRIYGTDFKQRVAGLGLREALTAPRSPWQNAYAERFIGSLRRECLDHVIVLNERHFRRVLWDYVRYYNGSRTHLALEKDAPEPRAVHERELGQVIALPEVRGLHHRYERRAA